MIMKSYYASIFMALAQAESVPANYGRKKVI